MDFADGKISWSAKEKELEEGKNWNFKDFVLEKQKLIELKLQKFVLNYKKNCHINN